MLSIHMEECKLLCAFIRYEHGTRRRLFSLSSLLAIQCYLASRAYLSFNGIVYTCLFPSSAIDKQTSIILRFKINSLKERHKTSYISVYRENPYLNHPPQRSGSKFLIMPLNQWKQPLCSPSIPLMILNDKSLVTRLNRRRSFYL